MSASSRLKGDCEVYKHANNEHNKHKCTVRGCKNAWMISQAGGHDEWGVKGISQWVVCIRCDDHP